MKHLRLPILIGFLLPINPSLIPIGKTLISTTGTMLMATSLSITAPEKAKAGNAESYFREGHSKGKNGDNSGCIDQLNKAIALNSSSSKYYVTRAICKEFENDHKGAISDYTKAIDLGSEFVADLYVARGISRKEIGEMKDACADWRIGGYLGMEYGIKMEKKYCIN